MIFVPKWVDEKPIGECAYCCCEIYADDSFYASGGTLVCCAEHRDAYIAEHVGEIDVDDFTFYEEYEKEEE